jgi:hypothetical protein
MSEQNDDEQVLNESCRLTDNRGGLEWYPVRPGTVRLKVTGTNMVCEDDGKGNLVSAGVAVGIVDYENGTVVFNAPLPQVPAQLFEVSYYFNSRPD